MLEIIPSIWCAYSKGKTVPKSLTIATRASKLSLAQTTIVCNLLLTHYPDLEFNILKITTSGDKFADIPLASIGGKALFVKELEEALLDKRADFAIHSLKDVPTTLPDQLTIAATISRGDPYDVLLSQSGYSLATLPKSATVGSSSPRRKSQLLFKRPDLTIKDLRGNVDTRIKKLFSGEYDAIVLAQAGIDRLQLQHLPHYKLTAAEILPAAGQGAIVLECLAENTELLELLAPLSDAPTTLCVHTERCMNTKLNATCTTPVASFAELNFIAALPALTLTGLVASPDGQQIITAKNTIDLISLPDQSQVDLFSKNLTLATTLADLVANTLLKQGADKLLTSCCEL